MADFDISKKILHLMNKIKKIFISSHKRPSITDQEKIKKIESQQANTLLTFFDKNRNVFDFIKNPSAHSPPGLLYFAYVIIAFIGICISMYGFSWAKRLIQSTFIPFIESQYENLQLWASLHASKKYMDIRGEQDKRKMNLKYQQLRKEKKLKEEKEKEGWLKWVSNKVTLLPSAVGGAVTSGITSNSFISGMFMAYLTGAKIPWVQDSVKLDQVLVAIAIKFVLVVYYFMKELIETEILGIGKDPFYKRLYDNILLAYYNLISVRLANLDLSDEKGNQMLLKKEIKISEIYSLKNPSDEKELEKLLGQKPSSESKNEFDKYNEYVSLVQNLHLIKKLQDHTADIDSKKTLVELAKYDINQYKNINFDKEDDEEDDEDSPTYEEFGEDKNDSNNKPESRRSYLIRTLSRLQEESKQDEDDIDVLLDDYNQHKKNSKLPFYEIEDLHIKFNGPSFTKKPSFTKIWLFGLRYQTYNSTNFDINIVKLFNFLITRIIKVDVMAKDTYNDFKTQANKLDDQFEDHEAKESTNQKQKKSTPKAKGQQNPTFSARLKNIKIDDQKQKPIEIIRDVKKNTKPWKLLIEELSIIKNYIIRNLIEPIQLIVDRINKGRENTINDNYENDEKFSKEYKIPEFFIKYDVDKYKKGGYSGEKKVNEKYEISKLLYSYVPKSEREEIDEEIDKLIKMDYIDFKNVDVNVLYKIKTFRTQYINILNIIFKKHQITIDMWTMLCFLIDYEINLYYNTMITLELYIDNRIIKDNALLLKDPNKVFIDLANYSSGSGYVFLKNIDFYSSFKKYKLEQYNSVLKKLIKDSFQWFKYYKFLLNENFYKIKDETKNKELEKQLSLAFILFDINNWKEIEITDTDMKKIDSVKCEYNGGEMLPNEYDVTSILDQHKINKKQNIKMLNNQNNKN